MNGDKDKEEDVNAYRMYFAIFCQANLQYMNKPSSAYFKTPPRH